jgi:hypothetical protein
MEKDHGLIWDGVEAKTYTIQQPPPVVGLLQIIPGTRDVGFTYTRHPGRWHRFWARVLLGWVYEHKAG